jgi:hypothetical protein
VHQAAELLTAADIHFSKFLIVGHENESEADILDYPDYSLSHGVRLQGTTFFIMTPYPGTELARRFQERGLVTSQDWNRYTNFMAVVEPGEISDRRLQVLHAAVAMKYGVQRRFLAGKSVSTAIGRVAEPLLLLAKVGLLKGDKDRDQVAMSLRDALVAASGSATRPHQSRKIRNRVQFRFWLDGHPPVVLGSSVAGDQETLVIEEGGQGLDAGDRGPVVNVSLAHFVDLAARLRYRRLTNDALTLKWRPLGFRLAWIPGFVSDLGAVAGVLARCAAFHLVALARARHWQRG